MNDVCIAKLHEKYAGPEKLIPCPMQEASWRAMLQSHLTEFISPLLLLQEEGGTQCQLLNDSVELELHRVRGNTCTSCRTLPTQSDILCIARLDSFSTMFHGEVPRVRCTCVESVSSNDSQSSTVMSEGGLDRLPTVLMGVVREEGGGLALADSTGHVLCEVCSPN